MRDRRFICKVRPPNPKYVYHKPGEEYGQWTLVALVPGKGWSCKCSCGQTSVVQLWALKNGRSTRCRSCSMGAVTASQRTGRILPPTVAGFNRKLKDCKRGARERNLDWALSADEARQLFTSDCFYCGRPPQQRVYGEPTALHSLFVCNGIDRVDNSKGYTVDNSVPCCGPCNIAKHALSQDEFLDMVNRIAAKHPRTIN